MVGQAPAGVVRKFGVSNRRSSLNQKSAKKLLQKHGWRETRGGKHAVKMEKPGHRPITLPMHKGGDYHQGLTKAILKQAGL
jgi:predicted RNA binding protein YcfA (HicA-like mRNA interferase family)